MLSMLRIQSVLSIISFMVFGLLLLPILITLPLSFNSGSFFVYPLSGVSLRWYEEIFTNPVWLLAIKNSFLVATGTMLLASVLGVLASLGIRRIGQRAAGLTSLFLALPNMVPAVIAAVALFFFFVRFDLVGTLTGLVLAHTAIAIPFVVATVTSALQNFDSQLVRAASGLGAPPLRVFLTVTLPLIAPGVLSGAIFAFGISFDELIIALFLTTPETITLPRQIYMGINETVTPAVIAVSTLLFLATVGMVVAVGVLQRMSRRIRPPSETQ